MIRFEWAEISTIKRALQAQLTRLKKDRASDEFSGMPFFIIVQFNGEIHRIEELLEKL